MPGLLLRSYFPAQSVSPLRKIHLAPFNYVSLPYISILHLLATSLTHVTSVTFVNHAIPIIHVISLSFVNCVTSVTRVTYFMSITSIILVTL